MRTKPPQLNPGNKISKCRTKERMLCKHRKRRNRMKEKTQTHTQVNKRALQLEIETQIEAPSYINTAFPTYSIYVPRPFPSEIAFPTDSSNGRN